MFYLNIPELIFQFLWYNMKLNNIEIAYCNIKVFMAQCPTVLSRCNITFSSVLE